MRSLSASNGDVCNSLGDLLVDASSWHRTQRPYAPRHSVSDEWVTIRPVGQAGWTELRPVAQSTAPTRHAQPAFAG